MGGRCGGARRDPRDGRKGQARAALDYFDCSRQRRALARVSTYALAALSLRVLAFSHLARSHVTRALLRLRLRIRRRFKRLRRFERLHNLGVGAVPDAQGAILAAGDDDGFLLGRRRGVHEVGPAAEIPEIVAVVGRVEADRLVSAAAHEVGAAAHVLDRGDLLGVAADRALLFARLDVPDLDGVVGPGAGDLFAAVPPAHIEDVVGVPLEALDVLAGGDFVDLDELVGRPGEQKLVVGRKLDAEDRV